MLWDHRLYQLVFEQACRKKGQKGIKKGRNKILIYDFFDLSGKDKL
jgi:hypothetical protein